MSKFTLFTVHFISRTEFSELDGMPAEGDMIMFSEPYSPVFVVLGGEWVRLQYWQLDIPRQIAAHQANEEMIELAELDKMEDWRDAVWI